MQPPSRGQRRFAGMIPSTLSFGRFFFSFFFSCADQGNPATRAAEGKLGSSSTEPFYSTAARCFRNPSHRAFLPIRPSAGRAVMGGGGPWSGRAFRPISICTLSSSRFFITTRGFLPAHSLHIRVHCIPYCTAAEFPTVTARAAEPSNILCVLLLHACVGNRCLENFDQAVVRA